MLKLWMGWCGHDFRENAILVLLNSEYESATLIRNVGKYLPVYTASYPRGN